MCLKYSDWTNPWKQNTGWWWPEIGGVSGGGCCSLCMGFYFRVMGTFWNYLEWGVVATRCCTKLCWIVLDSLLWNSLLLSEFLLSKLLENQRKIPMLSVMPFDVLTDQTGPLVIAEPSSISSSLFYTAPAHLEPPFWDF